MVVLADGLLGLWGCLIVWVSACALADQVGQERSHLTKVGELMAFLLMGTVFTYQGLGAVLADVHSAYFDADGAWPTAPLTE